MFLFSFSHLLSPQGVPLSPTGSQGRPLPYWSFICTVTGTGTPTTLPPCTGTSKARRIMAMKNHGKTRRHLHMKRSLYNNWIRYTYYIYIYTSRIIKNHQKNHQTASRIILKSSGKYHRYTHTFKENMKIFLSWKSWPRKQAPARSKPGPSMVEVEVLMSLAENGRKFDQFPSEISLIIPHHSSKMPQCSPAKTWGLACMAPPACKWKHFPGKPCCKKIQKWSKPWQFCWYPKDYPVFPMAKPYYPLVMSK